MSAPSEQARAQAEAAKYGFVYRAPSKGKATVIVGATPGGGRATVRLSEAGFNPSEQRSATGQWSPGSGSKQGQGYQPKKGKNKGRTKLVNDPAHPFSAAELRKMQKWLDDSYLPTYKGEVVMSKAPQSSAATSIGPAMTGAVGPNDPRPNITMQSMDHEALMHEMGHVWQYWVATNAQLAAVEKTLHMTGDFFRPGGPLEKAADAYMEAAIHPNWHKWWEHQTKRGGAVTQTVYNYQAGPAAFLAIRRIFEQKSLGT